MFRGVLLDRNSVMFKTALRFFLMLTIALFCRISWAEDIEITKSANDDRAYRYLVLSNKLRILLISDPKTDKSAVSLDVNIGSKDDPESRPGLAHFLEHMLFLGTEKYPEAGEYQTFINAHGGKHNAYTAAEHTNYFFDIDPKFLEPAIDRFAQFFLAPLMDEKYVERERNAVHSEFKARYKNENRRGWDVYREIIQTGNNSARFSVGNLTTLADSETIKVRDDLLNFYKQYYSANIMTLVVLGKENLEQLEVLAKDKFSLVKNVDVTHAKNEISLFEEGFLPRKLFIRALKEQSQVSLMFPLPSF